MTKWQIILDVVIVLFILITIIINTKKGFFKTLLKSIKSLAVMILAIVLTPMLVGVIKDNIVQGWFDGRISQPFIKAAEKAGNNFNMEVISSSLPKEAKMVMSFIDVEESLNSFEGSGVELAQEFGGKLEGVLSDVVSYLITYIGLSIVLFIVLTVVFKLLEKIVEIPIFKKGDRILGFIWGVISSYVETSVLLAIIPFVAGDGFIAGTYVSRFIYEYGLFSFLLDKIL